MMRLLLSVVLLGIVLIQPVSSGAGERRDELPAVVTDMPDVIDMSYASPDTWLLSRHQSTFMRSRPYLQELPAPASPGKRLASTSNPPPTVLPVAVIAVAFVGTRPHAEVATRSDAEVATRPDAEDDLGTVTMAPMIVNLVGQPNRSGVCGSQIGQFGSGGIADGDVR
jgi:hypothetical protein